ncbi:MAG: hypothetical protein ABI076_07125 [Acidobacteriaceae bacterium]
MGYDWRRIPAEAVELNILRCFHKDLGRGFATNALLHDGGQAAMGQDLKHTVIATNRLISYWKDDFSRCGEACEFVTPEAWV